MRRAVASLRNAGYGVRLLAPSASGSALVGPGASEVDGLIAWDRADVASLLTEDGVPPGELQDRLSAFDAAVAFTRSAALLRALARLIPRVVAHDPAPPADSGHASEWLARPARQLGGAVTGALAVHAPTEDESTGAAAYLGELPEGFLAVHPGSGSPAKNWPAERFAAIAGAFAGGRPWLLVEGPADAMSAAPLRARAGAVPALAPPPRVLGAVLSRAGLYVGNDSGVTHLAAAWGAPTIALFGPTDPEVWSPVGPRVRIVRSATGRMDAVEVEAVLEAARLLMAQR